MIDELLKDFLEAEFDDEVPVLGEVPLDFPGGRMIIFQRTGREYLANNVCRTDFALQCYNDSLYEALAFADEVAAIMPNFVQYDEVSGVRHTNGPYNFTDPSTKRYRAQITYTITHYR